MTTWTTLATQNPGDRATAAWAQGIMENQIYLHEIGWHPYDMTEPDDGADGLLYDFAVTGVVASVETPNFEDGFEYRVMTMGLSHNSGATPALDLAIYGATSGAYGPTINMVSSGIGSSVLVNCYTDLMMPRATRRYQFAMVSSEATTTVLDVADMTTSQKIGKAKVQFSAGSIDAGQVYLFRRRSLIS
jgi:hypothetical protein